MSQPQNIQDRQTGRQVRVAPSFGELLAAKRLIALADYFEQTTLDTDKWIATTGSGGAATPANGILPLTTSTNAAGNASIDANYRMAPLAGAPLHLHALFYFGTDADTDNTREIGFRDDAETTKVCLQLDDSTLTFRVEDAGSPIDAAEIVGSVSLTDNKLIELDIIVSRRVCECWLNQARVAHIHANTMTAVLMQNTVMRAYADIANSGSTTSNTLDIVEIAVGHLGDLRAALPRPVAFASGGADAQIIYGPGILWAVINEVDNGETYVLRDGTSAAGQAILAGTAFSAVGFQRDLHGVPFYDGLYFDHTGGGGNDTLRLLVSGVG